MDTILKMMADAQEAGRSTAPVGMLMRNAVVEVLRPVPFPFPNTPTRQGVCLLCGGKTTAKDGVCRPCKPDVASYLADSRAYAPKRMRLTSNLLGASRNEFWIAYDTPSYCDPGSESYHCM